MEKVVLTPKSVNVDSIVTRLSKLDHMLMGRSCVSDNRMLVTRDGLLDTLLLLYEECNQEYLSRNQYVTAFTNKYDTLMKELCQIRISTDDFNAKGVIGRGHFGEVQVVVEKVTGDVYAMKTLRKADTLSQQNVSFYEEERDIMMRANSPWLTQLHYAFQDRSNLYLVMDYHPGGDLLSLLSKYDDVFAEPMARFYLAEMVLAIHALHAMGYVHRDIKPENILMDRTGHIKLADFGSATRLAATKSSRALSVVPVGTPDYISPEVLQRLNRRTGPGAGSSSSRGVVRHVGMRGDECEENVICGGEEGDWWSLGVCAYEMLYGKTPFTDHDGGSTSVTYANIMSHEKSLKFPVGVVGADGKVAEAVSKEAIDFIQRLLTGSNYRLNYEQIRLHHFFADTDFDNIRQVRPPYLPTVRSCDDMSNFDEFTKVKSVHFSDQSEKRTEFSGKDLPFLGFTYTKHFGSSSTDEQSSLLTGLGDGSTAPRSSLERRLTLKSAELLGVRERMKDLEHQTEASRLEVDSLKRRLTEREQRLERVEDERNRLEKDVALYVADINALKRSLEQERLNRKTEEMKVTLELDELNKSYQHSMKFKDEQLQRQSDEFQEIIAQLEEERVLANNRIAALKRDVTHLTRAATNSGASAETFDDVVDKITTHVTIECRESNESRVRDLSERLRKQEIASTAKEKEMLEAAEKANKEYFEMKSELQSLMDSRSSLQFELDRISAQANSDLRKLSDKLAASEERERVLKEAHRLQEFEERERELTYELPRMAALNDRIKDLEEQVHQLEMEKFEVENQSLIVFEENEERLRLVHEQEAVISMLKTNVDTLEEQINSLKADLLEVRVTSSSRRQRQSSASRTPTNQDRKGTPLMNPLTNRRSAACSDDAMWNEDAVKLPIVNVGRKDSSPDQMSAEVQTDGNFRFGVEFNNQQQQTSFVVDGRYQANPVRQSDATQTSFMLDTARRSRSPARQSMNSSRLMNSEHSSTKRESNSDQTPFSAEHQQHGQVNMANAQVQAFDDKERIMQQANSEAQTSFVSVEDGQRNVKHRVSVLTTTRRSTSRSKSPHARQSSKSPRRYVEVETETSFSFNQGRSGRVEIVKDKHADVNIATSISSEREITSGVGIGLRRSSIIRPTQSEASSDWSDGDSSNDADHVMDDLLLDDLVEANSESSLRTVDIVVSSRLHCRKTPQRVPPAPLSISDLRQQAQHENEEARARVAMQLYKKNVTVVDASTSPPVLRRMSRRSSYHGRFNDASTSPRRRSASDGPEQSSRTALDVAEIERLKKEIERIKDSTHEQRIRVLDLKHELREKSAESANEIASLTYRLSRAESEAADANESLARIKEKEAELRTQFEGCQLELITGRVELRKTIAALESCKTEFGSEVDRLKVKLENKEQEASMLENTKVGLLSELAEWTQVSTDLENKNTQLASQLKTVTSEKRRLELSEEQLKKELTGRTKMCEDLEKKVDRLKEMLEGQLQDFEVIVERKEAQLKGLIEGQATREHGLISSKDSEIKKLSRELDQARSLIGQHKVRADSLNQQLIELEHAKVLIEAENRSLKCKLDGSSQASKTLKDDTENRLRIALTEMNCLRLEVDKTKQNLSESQHDVDKLKRLCIELESQIHVLEQLNAKQELQLETVARLKDAEMEKSSEMEQLRKQIQACKLAKSRSEEMCEELRQKLASNQNKLSQEIDLLRTQIAQQNTHSEALNKQLMEAEQKCSLFAVDERKLKRNIEALENENIALKEEISREITRCYDQKRSSIALNHDLEKVLDDQEALANQHADLQSQRDAILTRFNHDKYIMAETINQQSKLINFLQLKVENTPRKKKAIFKRSDSGNSSLQHSLDQEREKSAGLRAEIARLKDQLNQAQTRAFRLSNQVASSQLPPLTVTSGKAALGISSQTLPSSKAGHYASLQNVLSSAHEPTTQFVAPVPPSPRTPMTSRTAAAPVTVQTRHSDVGASRSSSLGREIVVEGSEQKKPIPHRYSVGINNRPTKCIVCLGSVHFVQEAARCIDCGAVCHPACLPNLKNDCGVPSEYMRYMAEVWAQQAATTQSGARQSGSILNLVMASNMKVLRSSRQIWEQQWVTLHNNKIFMWRSREEAEVQTTSGTASGALNEFDLCPSNGDVYIESAVTSSELTFVSSTDLPYIIALQFEPDTTCWPARTMYLMASNFQDKQQWVAALESITSCNVNSSKIKDVKVLGNTMLKLSRDRWLDINCTWPLNDDVILVGTASGLYAMRLVNTAENRPLVKINGINSVYAINASAGTDFLLLVTGQGRDLITVDVGSIQRFVTQPSSKVSRMSVQPRAVVGASTCTVFSCSNTDDGLYLCAATATNTIILYKYNTSLKEFCTRKEIVTSRPCSCIHFGKQRVVFGTDKFCQIQLSDYSVTEFLDRSDTTLAFAIFGAAQYFSFPIAVLAVNESSDSEEFLLCFHEFGVFVDSQGRRSREDNIKWTGLPLAFAYREPFLYTIHFNALQLMKIMPKHSANPIGLKTFVNIVGAQYLGPALTAGAVYIGSAHDRCTEIICIKGNCAPLDAGVLGQSAQGKENSLPNTFVKGMMPKHPRSPGKRTSGGTESGSESGFVSNSCTGSTPSVIRKMSTSPKRARHGSSRPDSMAQ